MFNYNRLYNSWGRGSPAELLFYAEAMNYICAYGNQSDLNTFKPQINLTAANMRTVAQPVYNTYILAQDAFGYQVFVNSNDAWLPIWQAIFQGAYAGPLSATTLCAGMTFAAIKTWAEAIYADLNPLIPDLPTNKVFFSGHGVGGVIAILLANKFQTSTRPVGTVATFTQPRAFDETMWNALTPDIRYVFWQGDMTSLFPPALIWDPSFYAQGIAIPAQMYFKGQTIPIPDSRSARVQNMLQGFVAAGQNRFNWPDAVNGQIDAVNRNDWYEFLNNGNADAYINLMWYQLPEALKVVLDEVRSYLNTRYGFTLAAGRI